jgi:hypothetical protein
VKIGPTVSEKKEGERERKKEEKRGWVPRHVLARLEFSCARLPAIWWT